MKIKHFGRTLLFLWHGTPLIPLLWDRYILSVIFILVVLLPYIKVKKLQSKLSILRADGQEDSQEIRSIVQSEKFWRWLTF